MAPNSLLPVPRVNMILLHSISLSSRFDSDAYMIVFPCWGLQPLSLVFP